MNCENFWIFVCPFPNLSHSPSIKLIPDSLLCQPTPPSRPGVLPPRARSLPGPGYWGGEGHVSTEEEKISAWRGLRTMEERDSWGGSRVTPEGVNLFPKENLCKLLFAPNFTFTFISESEIRPFTFCLCTVCNSM